MNDVMYFTSSHAIIVVNFELLYGHKIIYPLSSRDVIFKPYLIGFYFSATSLILGTQKPQKVIKYFFLVSR